MRRARAADITNRDKVFFPSGITKGDLADYYERIAPVMLPHLAGRPVTLHRFPNGIDEAGFYQKDIGTDAPEWVATATVEKEGGQVRHVLAENADTLVYLADLGTITPHVWLSRADRPRHPDRMIIDVDPPGSAPKAVRSATREVRDLLRDLDCPAYVMTTGSSGFHVVTPLDGQASFAAVRQFARNVAHLVAARRPERITVEARKDKRDGRVYLDTARNAYAQTGVAPYAVRSRAGAPIATPLADDEIDRRAVDPQEYGLDNIFRRLGQRDDPWRTIDRRAVSLEPARPRLNRLLAAAGLGTGN